MAIRSDFSRGRYKLHIEIIITLIVENEVGWSKREETWKIYVFKACVRYFYRIFIFSANDGPSKTMKNDFYFMKKALFVLEIIEFLYFHLPLFFSHSAIALEDDWRYILKFGGIICLYKNLITHFVWCLGKVKRYDIELGP